MLTQPNNFHLIRLLAATQVLLIHARYHLSVSFGPLAESAIDFLKHFNGVPIFFTVSGFLVLWSFDRRPDQWKEYARNRALRIFPGLYGCLLVTLAVLVYFLGINTFAQHGLTALGWFAGQLTIFQFYTPDFLRSFGVGVPNGALWTIPVELQFYILVPFLWWTWRKWGVKTVWLMMGVSVTFYGFLRNNIPPNSNPYQLAAVTVLPYLYNFGFGMLFFVYHRSLVVWIKGKFWWWFVAYLAYIWLCFYTFQLYQPSYMPNFFGLIANGLLALVAISFAFSHSSLSKLLLGNTDLSYGIYIYQMVVINVLIMLGLTGQLSHFFEAIALTYFLSWISWKAIEKPALTLKKSYS